MKDAKRKPPCRPPREPQGDPWRRISDPERAAICEHARAIRAIAEEAGLDGRLVTLAGVIERIAVAAS